MPRRELRYLRPSRGPRPLFPQRPTRHAGFPSSGGHEEEERQGTSLKREAASRYPRRHLPRILPFSSFQREEEKERLSVNLASSTCRQHRSAAATATAAPSEKPELLPPPRRWPEAGRPARPQPGRRPGRGLSLPHPPVARPLLPSLSSSSFPPSPDVGLGCGSRAGSC